MIGRITGTLAVREADRVLVDTSGGVGYEVIVPARTLVGLPPVGSSVVLISTRRFGKTRSPCTASWTKRTDECSVSCRP